MERASSAAVRNYEGTSPAPQSCRRCAAQSSPKAAPMAPRGGTARHPGLGEPHQPAGMLPANRCRAGESAQRRTLLRTRAGPAAVNRAGRPRPLRSHSDPHWPRAVPPGSGAADRALGLTSMPLSLSRRETLGGGARCPVLRCWRSAQAPTHRHPACPVATLSAAFRVHPSSPVPGRIGHAVRRRTGRPRKVHGAARGRC